MRIPGLRLIRGYRISGFPYTEPLLEYRQRTLSIFSFQRTIGKTFYELLHAQQGVRFTGKSESAFLFNSILKEMSQTNANDQKLSLMMYNLIAGLAIPGSEDADENVLRAQQFIDDNFYKPITVDDIADYAGLSRYHSHAYSKRRPATVPISI